MPEHVSHKTHQPSEDAGLADDAKVEKRFAVYETAMQWTPYTPKLFRSQGHWFGRYRATVRGNVKNFPSVAAEKGALLVETLFEDDGKSPIKHFVMEKHGDQWQFSVLSPKGVIEQDGHLEPCFGCHQHAKHTDAMFPLPNE